MTPEVADLWDRALQALRTAGNLVRSDPDAAASRAYYAAFYAIGALFALENRNFTKHTAVEAAVHRDLVKTGRWPTELGAAFSWLASLRYTGDYGGESHVGEEEATEAVQKTRQILQAVRKASPEPLRDLP